MGVVCCLRVPIAAFVLIGGGGARRALPIVDSGGAVASGLVYFVSIQLIPLISPEFGVL